MRRLWCLALCVALLAACGGQNKSQTTTIFAMDTVMDLTVYGFNASKALRVATQEIDRLDALLSTGRPDSDISKINTGGDRAPTQVSDETAGLIQDALALCQETDGALDITVYPAMVAWGFPSGEYRVPAAETLARLQTLVDYRDVTVSGSGVTCAFGQKLDLGALGKGYAGDRVIALWRDMGVTSGIISLGGNVQCLGAKPDGTDWVVGIRAPEDENALLATVTGRDMAVVTSGAYQRNFTRDGVLYHHILDPKTCAPARGGAASVTVVGESGFVCDGLSTALYVMGAEKAADYWRAHRDFDLIYYTDAGELWYTAGLAGRVTLRDGLEGQMLT